MNEHEAEQARREAEAVREEAEDERVANEEVRQVQEGAGSSEVSRVEAESDRDDTEVERVGAESDRDIAEVARAAAALSRREAEKGRVEAEGERVTAEDKRRSVRFFYAKLAAVVALPLAFLALIPAAVGLYLVNERADDNRVLIDQAERDRQDYLARFKRGDVLLCREIEALKRQRREEARENYRRLDQTLALLNIKKTPAIVERAREDFIADLKRNERLECAKLPSVFRPGG